MPVTLILLFLLPAKCAKKAVFTVFFLTKIAVADL